MIGDLLLGWMSERRRGTIPDLRARIAWLARTTDLDLADHAVNRWLQDASSVGHCELDWSTGRWSVGPPVVARLPLADGLAVLVGSRRPGFIEALEAADIYFDLAHAPPAPGVMPQPSTIFVPYDTLGDLEAAAFALGSTYVGCAAESIARSLPAAPNLQATAPPAYDSPLERLASTDPPTWSSADSPGLPLPSGLYREEVRGRWRYTVHSTAHGWFACDRATGVYSELARLRQTVIRWRPESTDRSLVGFVFVDQVAPLPTLHSRVLALCSGFAPRIGAAAETIIYDNVPREIAAVVAASLGQIIRIDN